MRHRFDVVASAIALTYRCVLKVETYAETLRGEAERERAGDEVMLPHEILAGDASAVCALARDTLGAARLAVANGSLRRAIWFARTAGKQLAVATARAQMATTMRDNRRRQLATRFARAN